MTDAYGSEAWTEMELRHLLVCLNSGDTIEQAAQFLGRSDRVDEVRRKAEELGWSYTTHGSVVDDKRPQP